MYELDKIKILLIDSQTSIRSMTEAVLKEFGAKAILQSSTSAEAFSSFNGQTPDLIIVDHVLRPDDGVQFTSTLRGGNTQLHTAPVIFTSSISAKDRVYAARDAGITEFLAKPFTAETLYQRIFQVVEHPRHFIEADNFRGPDRRRRNALPPGLDKRGKKQAKDVRILEPDRILRQKVGTGGLPPALIKMAQIRMEEVRAGIPFGPVAMESLDWQRKTLTTFMSGSDEPSHAKSLRDLQDAWALLKGNAASFGFTLVQEISLNLTNFLDPLTDINNDTAQIVEAHEDAIRTVIQKNIRDKNNPLGYALLEELKKANLRYLRKYPPGER